MGITQSIPQKPSFDIDEFERNINNNARRRHLALLGLTKEQSTVAIDSYNTITKHNILVSNPKIEKNTTLDASLVKFTLAEMNKQSNILTAEHAYNNSKKNKRKTDRQLLGKDNDVHKSFRT